MLKEKSVFRHCNENFEEKNKLFQKEDRQNRFTISNYFSLQNEENLKLHCNSFLCKMYQTLYIPFETRMCIEEMKNEYAVIDGFASI